MPEKILIVDDDSDLRSELKDALCAYEVREAASGEEALRLLRNANEIKAIILDLMLPGVGGLDILTEIKKTDPQLSIVILTGHGSKDTAVSALKGHADDYIEKPVNPQELINSIERLLAQKRAEPEISAVDLKEKIERLKRFTRANRFKRLTLEDASGVVYLSAKYLSRVFKQVSGESFSSYRLSVKIEAAKELLNKTGYNINQIAEKVCYKNTESFIRQFKHRTGFTPTEYRHKGQNSKKKSR